jgi:hypothetical protein
MFLRNECHQLDFSWKNHTGTEMAVIMCFSSEHPPCPLEADSLNAHGIKSIGLYEEKIDKECGKGYCPCDAAAFRFACSFCPSSQDGCAVCGVRCAVCVQRKVLLGSLCSKWTASGKWLSWCTQNGLTYSTEQRPFREAESRLSGQKIHAFTGPKVSFPRWQQFAMDPVLSQLTPVNPFTSYFSKINCIIILLCTPRALQISYLNFAWSSRVCHAYYTPRPSHPSRFSHCNNIRLRVQIMEILIMQFSPPSNFPCLRPKCSLTAPFSNSVRVFPAGRETLFQNHTKQQTKV